MLDVAFMPSVQVLSVAREDKEVCTHLQSVFDQLLQYLKRTCILPVTTHGRQVLILRGLFQ